MTTKNLLLGLLIVAVFGVGILLGRFNSMKSITYVENKNPGTMHTTNQQTNASTTQTGMTSSMMSGMSDDQKKMLRALGIDVEKITPTMIACAETSLGASRVTEVKKGSSLSFTEKAKLIACYK